MLIAFQASGTRPPLIMVHGLFGFYAEDPALVQAVGPEQPVYGLSARGFDGSVSPRATVLEMAADYAAEIMCERSAGPYLIGGMCQGAKVAAEVARELMARGCEVGPVLLVDPGNIPHKTPEALETYERGMATPAIQRNWHAHAREVMRSMTRGNERLFDRNDPSQTEAAAVTAAATSAAISRHVPKPFWGATEIILSSKRAPNFFVPDHDWQKFLCGPRAIHVLEGDHMELLRTHQLQILRLVALYLDDAVERLRGRTPTTRPEIWTDVAGRSPLTGMAS
jgi:thioesterase domain-containing protein